MELNNSDVERNFRRFLCEDSFLTRVFSRSRISMDELAQFWSRGYMHSAKDIAIVYVYMLCVSQTYMYMISCLYGTFSLFPWQCNKWCDDMRCQFHRRKCDRGPHWLGNGKVCACSTFHNSIMRHTVEIISQITFGFSLNFLGILNNQFVLFCFVKL